ncbi:hypothetical protein, partial [Amycolatopsis speibonae]
MRGVPYVAADVGVIVGGGAAELVAAAMLLPKEAGVHGVVLLDPGVRDLVVIKHALLASGWNGRDAVRLFASEHGGLARFAVDLRQWLGGVAVAHPIDLLWFGVSGPGPAARVGSLDDEDGVPVPVWRYAEDGGWLWQVFKSGQHPDGWAEGNYHLPAPVSDDGLVLGL